MKKIIAICLLFIACSDEQLNAFTGGPATLTSIIHFDFDAYRLNTQSVTTLDSLILFLKTEGLAVNKIEVTGHCDTVGSNAYNDVLSLKRAQTVTGYLILKGIKWSLITGTNGYGKRSPLNVNQADNRRVEIIVQLSPATKAEIKADTLPKKQATSLPDTSAPETIDISKAQPGDIIQLPNINFYPDQHRIIESSIKNLKILLNTMLAYKTLRIEIRGHVCCTPAYQADALDIDTYTEDLSLQRAKQIYLYLAENGIARDRMTYIGLGAKYPLVKELTDHDKALNRRVEIKILSR